VLEAAGTGGARVAVALGGGGDGRSMGGSGAKVLRCSIFFSQNVKLSERFETDVYVDMLHV
jgi:hypothetical protein